MRLASQFIAILALSGVVLPSCLLAAEINWTTDYQAAFDRARELNRPVLLHFWTPSCGPCRRLEQTVFKQDRVVESLNKLYVPVKINADEFPQLASRHQVRSVPQDVIVSPAAELVHQMHTPQDAEQYVAQLAALAFRANGPVATSREYRAVRPGVASNNSERRARGSESYQAEVAAASSTGAPSRQIPLDRDETPAPKEVFNRFASRPNQGASSGRSATGENAATATPSNRSQRVAADETSPRPNWNRWEDPATARGQAPRNTAPATAGFAGRSADGYDDLAPPADASLAPSAVAVDNRYADDRDPRGQRQRQGQVADRALTAQAAPDRRAAQTQTAALNPRAAETNTARHNSRPSTPNTQYNIAQRKPSSTPMGMDGFCPVTLLQANEWVQGNPKFGVIHRGRTYLFKGQQEKQRFLDDPDEYSPVLAGIDPVALTEGGQILEGSRAHGVVYRRRVFLFSSEDNLNRFWDNPEQFALPIRQAMEVGDLDRLFR